MSTAKIVMDSAGVACLLIAGAVAIPGWATTRPTDSRRLTFRMVAWGFLSAAFWLWGVVDFGLTHWRWYLDMLGFFIGCFRVKHWWKAREVVLRLERSRGKAWLS